MLNPKVILVTLFSLMFGCGGGGGGEAPSTSASAVSEALPDPTQTIRQVASPNTIVITDNPGDKSIAQTATTGGDQVLLYGTKDATGLPLALEQYTVVAAGKDMSTATDVRVDAAGRITRIQSSADGTLELIYNAAGEVSTAAWQDPETGETSVVAVDGVTLTSESIGLKDSDVRPKAASPMATGQVSVVCPADPNVPGSTTQALRGAKVRLVRLGNVLGNNQAVSTSEAPLGTFTYVIPGVSKTESLYLRKVEAINQINDMFGLLCKAGESRLAQVGLVVALQKIGIRGAKSLNLVRAARDVCKVSSNWSDSTLLDPSLLTTSTMVATVSKPGHSTVERRWDVDVSAPLSPQVVALPGSSCTAAKLGWTWEGTLTQPGGPNGSYVYPMTMNILGEGPRVIGTSRLTSPQGWAEFEFYGEVINNRLHFVETTIRDQVVPAGWRWCMKTGDLDLFDLRGPAPGNAYRMEGPWRASGCSPGRIDLKKASF